MADEKIGISIEVKGTGAGIKSVKELKEEVKKLDETINKSDFGSEEYKKATAESEKLRAKMSELSGTESAKMVTSLKGLQQEYKKLKVALSEAATPGEFARISKELNDVEGKIGDINDAAGIATGSGVEQLQKGMALVGEGFRNFDFEKIKIGFKGIGNAMSAAAPLLLVAAIGALIENFAAVVDFVKTATGTWSDEEKAVKRATKAYEAQTKATTELVTQYDNELKILEAQGKSEGKILEVKKLKIAAQIQQLKASVAVQEATIKEIQANDDLSESLSRATAWVQRKLGNEQAALLYEATIQFQKNERIKEEQTKKEEALRTISSLEADLVVLQINNDKKVADSAKKNFDDAEKRRQEELKKIGEANKAKEDYIKQFSTNSRNLLAEEQAADTAAKKKKADEDLKIEVDKLNAEVAAKKLADEEKKKSEQEFAKQKEIIGNLSFNAAKGLSDAVFAIQLAGLKKGSAEELAVRKKAFQVDKAFAIAKATMDGYKAVLSTYAETPGGVIIKSAAATFAGIFAGANITKIALSKFDGGGSASAGSVSTSTTGTTSLPTPPTINTPQNNTNTQFDSNGNTLRQSNQTQTIDITGKIMLSENEVREKTNRANKLITQTTI